MSQSQIASRAAPDEVDTEEGTLPSKPNRVRSGTHPSYVSRVRIATETGGWGGFVGFNTIAILSASDKIAATEEQTKMKGAAAAATRCQYAGDSCRHQKLDASFVSDLELASTKGSRV